MMTLEEFGQHIAQQRAARNWTLRRLEEASGISFSNLSRIEHGMDTTLSSVLKLADAFDLPPAQLLSNAPVEITPDQQAVLAAYASADLEALTRLVLARIDALKAEG